jgi:hypothetical protein
MKILEKLAYHFRSDLHKKLNSFNKEITYLSNNYRKEKLYEFIYYNKITTLLCMIFKLKYLQNYKILYVRNNKTHGFYNSENLLITHGYNNQPKGFTLQNKIY